jgi:hypothetical protein
MIRTILSVELAEETFSKRRFDILTLLLVRGIAVPPASCTKNVEPLAENTVGLRDGVNVVRDIP